MSAWKWIYIYIYMAKTVGVMLTLIVWSKYIVEDLHEVVVCHRKDLYLVKGHDFQWSFKLHVFLVFFLACNC